MQAAIGGTVLTRDLVSADGTMVASRGKVVDLALLRDVAGAASLHQVQRPLHGTPVAEAVLDALEAPQLAHFCAGPMRGKLADAIADVRFPSPIWTELEAMAEEDRVRYQHAVWTCVVTARMFAAALGDAPGLQRLVGGALVHDLGMRHVASRLRWKRDHLSRSEVFALEDHPLFGALLLARFLGDVPAVQFALLHHARAGRGYPKVAGQPLRGLDVVSVASAFAAMVAPRPYRGMPFNARGAGDQLIEEAVAGRFDARAVRLLIHCLRGGKGPLTDIKLPRRSTGFRPTDNHHGLASLAATG